MNYPNDIKDRYADNGSVVHPEYRMLAGRIEGAFLFGDVDIIDEVHFETGRLAYAKFKDLETYEKALLLTTDLEESNIAAIWGMRSEKTIYIQMTGL